MRFSKALIPACFVSVCSGAAVVFEERNVCNVVDPVHSLLKTPLQAIATSFCSSYLRYPRTKSVTVTVSAPVTFETTTLPPPTTTVTITTVNTVDNPATLTITDAPTPLTSTVTVTAGTFTVYQKRDELGKRKLPPVLNAFAASRISSACSCIVTATTRTSTITAANTNTATITMTVTNTNTVTQTLITGVATTITDTITSHVQGATSTTMVTTTVTPILVKPKICNAKGLPGPNAVNYDTNSKSNQLACIAACKQDARCYSTGFYITTDPNTGAQTGVCGYYDKSVTDSANLGAGFYNWNDKAC